MVYEHPAFPADLKAEMYAWLREHAVEERKPKDTEEQFIYKARKKAIGPFKRRMWSISEENRRAIEEAAELSAQCLVLVVGGLPDGSRDIAGARALVEQGIAAILEDARQAGVPLAIEPLHPMYAADRACINTLAQANALCERLGEGIGIAVDVYHVWWDPELAHQIARTQARRLLGFHICDWLSPTTDLLTDRGMMGDGVIDIRGIRGWMQAAGYRGFHEVEIFSANNWWKRDPDEVLRTCKARHAEVC